MALDFLMEEAYRLAKSALAADVRPNPLVGAVVVSKQGEIIGRGYHQKYGTEHAEVHAIRDAHAVQADLSECTLYVTLEPCSHHGKTPPCTSLIIKEGIKRVVVGSRDLNPLVDGINLLRASGVEVVLMEDPDMYRLNQVFFVNKKFNRPFVALKMAMTIDGKIADRNGNSKWISNEESRNFVHEHLRTDADAILTTARTVIKDDAAFNIRKTSGETIDKDVLVLDRNFSLLDPSCSGLKLFQSHPHSVIEIFGSLGSRETLHNNIRISSVLYDELGEIDWTSFLPALLEKNYCKILVEGGSALATSLLKNNCIDELDLFIAPSVLADHSGVSLFQETSFVSLKDAKAFTLAEVKLFGQDVFLKYTR